MLFTLNQCNTNKYCERVLLRAISIIILLFLSSISHARAKNKPPEKYSGEMPLYQTCQWYEYALANSVAFEKYDPCVGMVGLMRLSRADDLNEHGRLKYSVKTLFGTNELPKPGTIVTIKRSAHLRTDYWPDRDDQIVSYDDSVCNRVGCRDTVVKKYYRCARFPANTYFWNNEGVDSRDLADKNKSSQGSSDFTEVKCPGPTDYTEYFSAGTKVKILGYQQMGTFFVLVQIIKIESYYPEEDEKKYVFDRKEVI